MPRNGFFGVRNSHFALMEDEDAFTYKDPVHVAGTVEIGMEPSVESAKSYADNSVWLESQQDTGGSGTMSFFDTESTPELRQLIADLVGWTIAADGHTILSANKRPKPFAFMCEQPGHVLGRRRCLVKCTMSKPSNTMTSTQGTPDLTQLDYPFSWEPIIPPGGTDDDAASGYDSFSDLDDYEGFFKKVDLTKLLEDPEKSNDEQGIETQSVKAASAQTAQAAKTSGSSK